jgi:hypothetical protein
MSPYRRSIVALCGGLLVAAGLAGAAAAQETVLRQCAVPRELVLDDPRLPMLAKRFQDHQPVTIVVIGGASTAGSAAGDEGHAYPHRLEEALRRAHPGATITVINEGGTQRQSAEEMVARFPRDVFANNPDLVIWETGTVDAVRGIDIQEFTVALGAGIDAVRQHKAELMLVDAQYNPETSSIINFSPYLDALHRTADLDEIYVFRRYDMMRYWSDAGSFDFVARSRARQVALAGEVYRCLGERMADAVDYAAR